MYISIDITSGFTKSGWLASDIYRTNSLRKSSIDQPISALNRCQSW